jgi:hypothetical protein
MDRDMRRFDDELAKFFDDPRLADARFSGEQYNLAFSMDGLAPAIRQQCDFLFAAYEPGQANGASGESARGRLFADDPPRSHWIYCTFDIAEFQFHKPKDIADQLAGRVGNDDSVALGCGLEVGRKIWGFANDRFFPRQSVGTVLSYDNEPGGYADASANSALVDRS